MTTDRFVRYYHYMKPITFRQREVLMVIYALSQRGLPPTFAELKDKLGITSNQTIKDHLDALVNKGYIRQESCKARAISINQKGFEEISNANKKNEFILDYDPTTFQLLNNSYQDTNSSFSFINNEQEHLTIFFKLNI